MLGTENVLCIFLHLQKCAITLPTYEHIEHYTYSTLQHSWASLLLKVNSVKR